MALERNNLSEASFEPTDTTHSTLRIGQILQRLLDKHCLLAVQIGKTGGTYTSAILEIVRQGSYLILDGQVPSVGHARLQDNTEIHLRAMIEGLEIRFSTKIVEIHTKNGPPFYKVALPTQIGSRQRRQLYRVPVPLSKGCVVTLQLSEAHQVIGELRDVSPEGLGLRISSGVLHVEQDRGRQAIYEIQQGQGRTLRGSIEICHIDLPARDRVLRVGARFVDVDVSISRRI